MRIKLSSTDITQPELQHEPSPTEGVPLVDLGSLMLYATRNTTVLPNVATIRLFKGHLTADELQREALRISSNPFGLGRKLEMPRVPGARPLWRANPIPPEVPINPALKNAAEVASYFEDEMSIRLDPLEGRGWRLAAAPYGDDTLVTLGINHLYGSGRDIVMSVWGDDSFVLDEEGRTQYHGQMANGNFSHSIRGEAKDLASRIRTGVTGIARLGSQAFTSPGERASPARRTPGQGQEPRQALAPARACACSCEPDRLARGCEGALGQRPGSSDRRDREPPARSAPRSRWTNPPPIAHPDPGRPF